MGKLGIGAILWYAYTYYIRYCRHVFKLCTIRTQKLTKNAQNISSFSKLFCFILILVVGHVRGPLCPAWYISFEFNCVAYYVFVLRCAKK